VRGVDVRIHVRDCDLRSAKAPRPAVGCLGRQLTPRIPHRILPRGRRPVTAIFQKIGLGALREEDGPGALERRPSRIESGRGAVASVVGIATRIEAGVPRPLVAAGRIASSFADSAGVHVAVEHKPSFVAGVRIRAAGQGGHAHMMPLNCAAGQPLCRLFAAHRTTGRDCLNDPISGDPPRRYCAPGTHFADLDDSIAAGKTTSAMNFRLPPGTE
jgi:hypothetical protein